MNIKFFTLVSIAAFAGITVHAQELTRKIPAQAQFVVAINNKAIIEKSSIELLNKTLIKLGAFQNTANDFDNAIKNFMELDLNLDKQAYVYLTSSDSLNYTGIVLPLKADHQVNQRMFSKFKELPMDNGYERRVSEDGKTQAAWNQESLLILTGDLHSAYFQREDVAGRYGLDLGYDGSEWTAEEDWTTEENDIEVDTIDANELWENEVENADSEEVEEVQEIEEWDESEELSYDSDSSYFDNEDLETDSLYLLNQTRETKNDSIKNDLFVNWLANDFQDYLEPQNNLAQNKQIKIRNQKTLLRIWFPNLDKLYQDALSYNFLAMTGFDIEKIKYGYKDATIDLILDQHSLKLAANVNIDQKLVNTFKALYKNKVNKKFTKYIPENRLAYASVNISTEGYLQQLPTLISRWYAPMAGEHAELLTIAATALEIGLDEKSIGKVMKGDHVFFLNDLHKVSKEFTTYEYDDDYNYEEITQTKEEYQPNFLWMFTSEDQRLFKKILEFAVKKQKVTLADGIYTINETNNMESMYILFKEDIVFLTSNLDQITAIQANKFKGSSNTKVKKDILSYPFNMIINTSAIPDVFDKLEISVTDSWGQTIQDLSAYGDLQIRSNKLRKNGLSGEISIELPKKDMNALQYLLNHVTENLDKDSIID